MAQPALDGGAASVEQGVTSQLEEVGIVKLGCAQQSVPAVGLVDVNGCVSSRGMNDRQLVDLFLYVYKWIMGIRKSSHCT